MQLREQNKYPHLSVHLISVLNALGVTMAQRTNATNILLSLAFGGCIVSFQI